MCGHIISTMRGLCCIAKAQSRGIRCNSGHSLLEINVNPPSVKWSILGTLDLKHFLPKFKYFC